MESSTCWTVPEPFRQSTFMIRSSASVKVPDCLGGTEGPPWHLRRFPQRKVTNSLVAGEMLRVARLANRTRPHQDVALRRSEEHTSELQSHLNLVCRLLLEKK